MLLTAKKSYFRLTMPGGIFLLLVMCWLSVCLPFQYQCEKKYQTQKQESGQSGSDNTILIEDLDEKTPVSNEEILSHKFFALSGIQFKIQYPEYRAVFIVASHSEFFSPPPDHC